MRRVLYLWLCGLGLCLTGCGLFDDDGPPTDPSSERSPPKVPVWESSNPTRGNANEVVLKVQVAPGNTVEFFSGTSQPVCAGAVTQSVTADEAGLAAATFQVPDNSRSHFRARARNSKGIASDCTDTFIYQEDSTPPQAPQWVANLPKHSNANVFLPKVTVERGSRLSLFRSGDCTGSAIETVTAGEGTGTFTFTLTAVTVADDTANPFSVAAADDLGNTACSTAFTFFEDSTSPPPPVITATAPTSPGQSTSPDMIGTAEPGSTVLLYMTVDCSGTEVESGTVNDRGEFRVEVDVPSNAAASVRARVRDAAGNLSGCSDPRVYIADSIGPGEPTFQRFAPVPPANDNAPVLIGTAEPGSKVWIHTGSLCRGEPVASAITDARGIFEATLSVADDVTLEFSAWARDVAGNAGFCHTSFLEYIEDSTAPRVSGVTLSPSSPSNANRVTVSIGTASHPGEKYGTASLFTTPDCLGAPVVTTPVGFGGGASLAITVPDDSTTRLFVNVQDFAGNTSACSGPWTFVEDSTSPSRAGATVTDGPAEDLSHQLTGELVEAHWAGFSDDRGISSYEHFLATRADCLGTAETPNVVISVARVRLDGLSLPDGAYYHCVRAWDQAGNKSAWMASNGFRVDLLAPVVEGTTPPADQREVDLVAPIRVTFSEPMDPSTVTAETFTASIGGAPVSGTVACTGATCAFTPSGPLPYREQVDVRLSAAVKDLAGRALASPYAWSFSTRGRAWSREPLPVNVVRPGLFPDVAVDGQGRALAVWVQGVGDTFRPYAAGYLPYVGWSAPQELGPLGTGNVEQPAVAMNTAGRAVAVWVLRNGTQADLYAAEYAPGGGWSAPQAVESRAEAVSTPRVVVDGSGNALVVWRQSDGTAESAWAARLVVGVGWSAPLLLEAGSGAVSAPALGAVGSGDALAAWTQPDVGGVVRVWASRFAPDTGWAAAVQAAAEGDASPVTVGLSSDGSAVIGFRTASGADSAQAWAVRYEPGSGWSPAPSLLGPAIPGTEELSVAMDRFGRAIAAWAGFDASRRTVFLKRFTPGSGWQRVSLETGPAGHPVVAADGQDNFHVLWVENLSGSDRVSRGLYPEGGIALSQSGPLEPGPAGTSKRPRLSTNVNGGAAAVWYRDNGTGFSGNLVYANLYQ